MPYHGLADVLNRELAKLTSADLVGHAEAVIDIAAGFGDDGRMRDLVVVEGGLQRIDDVLAIFLQ